MYEGTHRSLFFRMQTRVRIAAIPDNSLKRVLFGLLSFKKTEGEKLKDGDSSCQGFGHILHELKLLRSGKEPSPIQLSLPVYSNFYIGQDFRHILDFIKNHLLLLKTVQESVGIFNSDPALYRIVETDICRFLTGFVEKKCGFTRLPRPCHKDGWKVAHCVTKFIGQKTWRIHLTIIRYNFIIVKCMN